MESNIFINLSIVVFIAVSISYIMNLLKQPLIIGYIITWVILSLSGIIGGGTEMKIFSEIGIAILLFMVWLNLNPNILKEVGKVSIFTGIWQVIFTTIIGIITCQILGFDIVTSLYIAIAISFSSTIVIMKLLSDKWDLSSLYGKISIGFLITQDIIAMLILMIISFSVTDGSIQKIVGEILIKWVWLVGGIILISTYILPKLMKKIAKSQELLELFAIWRCLLLASLFYLAGFSIEIWALIAWITLSTSPFKFEITSKTKSLRDFFIVIFFVLFGTHMTLDNIWIYIIPIIVLSIIILIGNPAIVMYIMWRLGYTKRVAFNAGLTVAQISEFSFIVVILWASIWHVSNEILSMISIIWLITISWSTYFILYSGKIYNFISPYLSIFERRNLRKVQNISTLNWYEVILFGYDPINFETINLLENKNKDFLIIEYNPETIKYLQERNINAIYADGWDIESLEEILSPRTKMIICSSRELQTNIVILKKAKSIEPKCIVINTANTIQEAIKLYEIWADYVIIPHLIGWLHISSLIQENEFDAEKFNNHKKNHIKKINEIKTYKIIEKEKQSIKDLFS